MRSLVRTGLLALVCLVLGAGPAAAHASLIGTDPGDGSTHAAAPRSVTFRFNENVGNAQVAAQAPDGSRLTVGTVSAVDNTVEAALPDAGQKGRYSVSYRVVSADGHPVAGTITYDVTTGRAVKQVEPTVGESFLHRHSAHLFWGILAAAVAVALLLLPLRRRDDASDA